MKKLTKKQRINNWLNHIVNSNVTTEQVKEMWDNPKKRKSLFKKCNCRCKSEFQRITRQILDNTQKEYRCFWADFKKNTKILN